MATNGFDRIVVIPTAYSNEVFNLDRVDTEWELSTWSSGPFQKGYEVLDEDTYEKIRSDEIPMRGGMMAHYSGSQRTYARIIRRSYGATFLGPTIFTQDYGLNFPW